MKGLIDGEAGNWFVLVWAVMGLGMMLLIHRLEKRVAKLEDDLRHVSRVYEELLP